MASLRETLEKLASLRSESALVTSLYLHLRPEERQDNKYLRIYKDMVKEKKEELSKRNLSKGLFDSLERDFETIGEFLSEPKNLDGCRGIAIFSCSAENIFEVVKLPYVYRNRLMVAPDPLIREIAAIDEEFGKVAVLLLDRKHVRYFLMDIEETTEKVDFLEPLATRAHRFHSGGAALKGAQGTFQLRMPSRGAAPNMVQHSYGEWRFHMRIREEWHRVLKLAADAAFEDWKESKFDRLVIGGFLENGIREIENHLHRYLKERLLGYIEVNTSEAKPTEVREKVLNLLWEKDREEERKLISELEELIGKGLAVNGTSKVLDMLAVGNVRTILVPENFEKPGYLCPETHLVSLKPECPLEGEKPVEIGDIVDEVIEEALDQKATVEIVVNEELQRKIDGLAAFLRFSL
ncbi:peptide chain release factor subunit 1 [Hydrogenivirga caldilitoris]|uniref:Peptide chain release factor subunit 1 n=1 Tax=Hydrogenivirga caldilitoris TaxID=246264 RepID=A0A497XRJ6_9AQUI|nr:peptide chain release factor 1 [Hydrogenivirga caldilitoris]RLJ70770.1 peptide chain release factor subunit 1 [Hydrogenivirga caldilitoris]